MTGCKRGFSYNAVVFAGNTFLLGYTTMVNASSEFYPGYTTMVYASTAFYLGYTTMVYGSTVFYLGYTTVVYASTAFYLGYTTVVYVGIKFYLGLHHHGVHKHSILPWVHHKGVNILCQKICMFHHSFLSIYLNFQALGGVGATASTIHLFH